MSKYSRRSFVKMASLSAATLSMPSLAFGALPRVVVIGGGAGGATAAKYIAKDSKGKVDVTLIEASKRYYTCFFSNLYLWVWPWRIKSLLEIISSFISSGWWRTVIFISSTTV